jgi:hypothetical protein
LEEIESITANPSNEETIDLVFRGEWATANPSKISLSQSCTMSTFYMAQALLTKAVLYDFPFLFFKLRTILQ